MMDGQVLAESAVERPAPGWWAAILGGLALNAAVGFDARAFAAWSATVTTALEQSTVRNIFLAAVAAHAGEAWYAWRVAQGAGLRRSAAGWCLQTLLLGFPSLRLLLRRVRAGARPVRLA